MSLPAIVSKPDSIFVLRGRIDQAISEKLFQTPWASPSPTFSANLQDAWRALEFVSDLAVGVPLQVSRSLPVYPGTIIMCAVDHGAIWALPRAVAAMYICLAVLIAMGEDIDFALDDPQTPVLLGSAAFGCLRHLSTLMNEENPHGIFTICKDATDN